MAEIQVAKVEQRKKGSKRELYATICYHYGYKLSYVQNLPARDLYLLHNTAIKQEANMFLNLTNITAAPQSKKGQSVKKLIDYYRGVINK